MNLRKDGKKQPPASPTDGAQASSAFAAPALRTRRDIAGLSGPNPQGKGVVGFLEDWDYSAPRHIIPKRPGRLLADYFTSLLVLSADFRFKPVFGQTYHLYHEGARWSLSLLSPEDWRTDAKRASYVGACVLHSDSTWSIEPSENLSESGALIDAISDAYTDFLQRLETNDPLEAGLPFYEAALPWYPRMFAAAVGRSVRASLHAAGRTGVPARDWLQELPRDPRRLLGN